MMLDSRHLEIVRAILLKYVPHYEVRMFGSRANGVEKKHSDLDIVVMTSEPLSVKIMTDLRHNFSESNLPFKVDVIDWSAINKNFKKIILQSNYEILQQKQKRSINVQRRSC